MYYVYVIINQSGKIYIGQTADIEKRLRRHNKEYPVKPGSYTSINRKGIWKLVYKEEYLSRREAVKREKELKSFRGRQFIKSKINMAR